MNERGRMTRAAVWALAGVLCAGAAPAGGKPTPPGQPKTGPGGAAYAHAKVQTASVGQGNAQAWIFEPADPAPKTAPVVVFLHGWAAMTPRGYRAWIHHTVRRGSLVIYPRYQATLLEPPLTMTGNAVAGIKNALAELKKPGHVRADETRVVVAGHSLGGVIAANLAAGAKAAGLPRPGAVFCIEPGDSKHSHTAARLGTELPTILHDYAAIPKATLFVILVGDADRFVGDRTARKIWQGVQHLPKRNRDYVVAVSDRRGAPPLIAGHFFPAAPGGAALGAYGGLDALDYYGTWKLLDGLTDAVFHGRNRTYALGNTAEQRYMGKWSDGTPVKELHIADK